MLYCFGPSPLDPYFSTTFDDEFFRSYYYDPATKTAATTCQTVESGDITIRVAIPCLLVDAF